MPAIEAALCSQLQTVAARVYPVVAPQEVVTPYVLYHLIDTTRKLTHDDRGYTGTLATHRFQVEVWAATYSEGKTIASAILQNLNGLTGTLGTGVNQVTVRAVLADGEQTDFQPDFSLYRLMSDYLVWMEE